MDVIGVRGMKSDDVPVDQKPAQASSGSEVCEDVDGVHVSDDGDGEALPVTKVECASRLQAPNNPSSVQLQLGKADLQGQPKTDTDPSTAGVSSNALALQPPLEVVTVSSMPPRSDFVSSMPPTRSDFDAGGITLFGDQPEVVPSIHSRVFSYESLEKAMKDGGASSSQGVTVAVSHGHHDTPSSSRAESAPPEMTSISAPPDMASSHGQQDTPSFSRAESEPNMPSIRAPPGMPSIAHANSPTSTASSSGSWNIKSKQVQVSSLRRGKWTSEEEAYVARVIQDFNSGFLDAPAGTTLRTYLSEKLQCDPMRITKKFTGDACIGKRVFHPAVRSPSNAASIDKAQSELDGLEQRWRRRLEMQLRDHAKKAAASAAAAAAATGRPVGIPLEGQVVGSTPIIVTQTASWLDRAKSVLKDPSPKTPGGQEKHEEDEIMTQMQEVERLIHEGPSIQQTSVGLSHVVDHQPSTTSSPPVEPADKRLRTGAEDAEALVGFLRSVRASAASGEDC